MLALLVYGRGSFFTPRVLPDGKNKHIVGLTLFHVSNSESREDTVAAEPVRLVRFWPDHFSRQKIMIKNNFNY